MDWDPVYIGMFSDIIEVQVIIFQASLLGNVTTLSEVDDNIAQKANIMKHVGGVMGMPFLSQIKAMEKELDQFKAMK